jgi:hypothetical protein
MNEEFQQPQNISLYYLMNSNQKLLGLKSASDKRRYRGHSHNNRPAGVKADNPESRNSLQTLREVQRPANTHSPVAQCLLHAYVLLTTVN